MTSWLMRGLPRQLVEMKLNRRCSILFHLLVPGGKWQTAICRPVLIGEALQLELPEAGATGVRASAVSGDRQRRWRSGSAFLPIVCHQSMDRGQANVAVSWSIPTLTHPSSAVRS